MKLRYIFFISFLLFFCNNSFSQNSKNIKKGLSEYFENYTNDAYTNWVKIKVEDLQINPQVDSIRIYLNESFASQPFTPAIVEQVYLNTKRLLPAPYNGYNMTIFADGTPIENLIPIDLLSYTDTTRIYGKTDYTGHPWVKQTSLPYSISHGLQNRHFCVWASHGKYYNNEKQEWIWQRPRLFCTTEDLFTQTIVVPYLIPMLQNAGAIIFTPRERDWQRYEVIVDNDHPETNGLYREFKGKNKWEDAGGGFAQTKEFYQDNENPFADGTCRMTETNAKRPSTIIWQPNIVQDGEFAVYVSYKTLPNSVPDAQYTVRHEGVETTFRVNQQMGGGTWVYLGTFKFSAGNSERNCVLLSNNSEFEGTITADAVRFGGGMSNIVRSDSTVYTPQGSGLPRFLEAARYSAQWYGFPHEVYARNYHNDYNDDINVRPSSENHLARGSMYLPGDSGLNVPLELSLAIHSDAGYRTDDTFVGSLGIYTTKFYDGKTAAGLSRLTSRDFVDYVMTQVSADISAEFGTWCRRQMYNRNYGETREPQFPAIILEILSHQNWADMKMAHDPYFKFILARSIYKGILRYMASVHQIEALATQPLPVNSLTALAQPDQGKISLSWAPTYDKLDATASPTHYVIYTKKDNDGYDNGTLVDANNCTFTINAELNSLYQFRVAAVNSGGSSLLSDEVCAYIADETFPNILLIDGFQRVAAPLPINNDSISGFDFYAEPGVIDVKSPGYCGGQLYFNKDGFGKESAVGHGFSGSELEGMILAGNTHNYSTLHAQDILAMGRYNISSCTSSACGTFSTDNFHLIDMIFGAQKDDRYSTRKYKTFTPQIQQMIASYTQRGGNVLVSGAFIGSDMLDNDEQTFTRDVLKYQFAGFQPTDSLASIQGMNTRFSIYTQPNEENYWLRSVDVLQATDDSFCAMLYEGNNFSAATAYKGNDYHVIAFGFPLECIREQEIRQNIISGAIQFLINK